MSYKLELQKLKLKKEAAPLSEDRIKLLKQAIQLADANNDLNWGFDFRLEIITEEVNTSHCIESFAAFAWILDATDKNPELFDESEFLWEYKWMTYASYRNASIPKEQIEKILEDLKNRMHKNGYSLKGYYSVLIDWYQFIGNTEEATRHIELRKKEAEDDMANCPACEIDTEVEVELEKENYEEALYLAQDLINKKLSCAHMPFGTFCHLASSLNKIKDPRAEEFFKKSVEELKNMNKEDGSLLISVSKLINYLIDHNPEEAFTYFEKCSSWEFNAEDALKYAHSKNVFRLFDSEESRNLKLDAKHPLYNPSGHYKLKDLYQYYYNQAEKLAEKFDQRNQTTYLKEKLKKELLNQN